MKVKLCPAGSFQSNTYILYDEITLEALIIDAGDGPQRIVNYLQENSLKPGAIILTHHHSDHVGAAAKLRQATGAPVCIHEADGPGLRDLAHFGIWNLLRPRIEINPDRFLHDGDALTVGDITVKVVHTPGHSPGSICLEVEGKNIVFTGDTIFADGIGRTDFKGGDLAAMRTSLCDKVNQWPDQVTICPGHGPTATMAQVRAQNGLFRTIIAGN